MTSSCAVTTTTKICFNPDCKESKIERLRKGWRLRIGDFAELCDRCASAYEEGRFCEQYHTNAAGWRGCESCRKPLHCGCIVSIHSFVLLDAGGIECMACARKHSITSWSLLPLPLSERMKDTSGKNWTPVAVPNGVSGQWCPRNAATSQSQMFPLMLCQVDRSNGIHKVISGERPSVSGLERVLEDPSDRAVSGSLDVSVLDRIANKNAVPDMGVALNAFNREEGALDGLQDSCHHPREKGSVVTRKGMIDEPGLNSSVTQIYYEPHSNAHVNASLQSSNGTDDLLIPQHDKAVPYTSPNGRNGSTSVSGTQPPRQTPPPPLSKQFHANSQNGVDPSTETQMRNGKVRGDSRGRNQLLPRYWPKITDQELQQISGDSNVVITPLFEKILSASDAGRIGRLVLPKKCAEAYFPTISQPEGVPLRVQDSKGQEWVFQFRFWPNNNSRMYVLEGVTPCIQAMQLQAGDTVTFSRIDPDGKLVMGFRKTSIAPDSNQENRKLKTGNGVSKAAEGSFKETNTWSEVDKSGYIAKDALRAKSSLAPGKRKSSTLGSKSKRLQIENEDLVELKITWEEAQGLLRPPLDRIPTFMVVDGHDFEEYEDAPIVGKPTIFTTNNFGDKIPWVQCEECSKWRKLPVDASIPSKWTCSDNLWDPKRSLCSSDPELTEEELHDLLNYSNNAPPKKTKSGKNDSDAVEGSEGLDTLANLAILGEVEAVPSSAQPPTTKHPRHRPGCTCIVCIQPPSGKGPKHSETCICNVCLTVRRRFRTLMERRGKRPPENESGTNRKKQHLSEKPEQLGDVPMSSNTNSELIQEMLVYGIADDDYQRPSSPFKGGIDLNIQPEREDESSPVSGSGSMKFLRDPTNLYHKKQRLESSSITRGLDQLEPCGDGSEVGADKLVTSVSRSCDRKDGIVDPSVPQSV